MSGPNAGMPRRSVADPYQDLLTALDDRYRESLVRRLAQGFYEEWRPTRQELADLILQETGQSPESGGVTSNAVAPSPSPSGRHNGSVTPSRHVRPARPGARSAVLAAFEIDCGELSVGFDFVARNVTDAGMVRRSNVLCRLVFLSYELRPITECSTPQRTTGPPDTFTGTIACISDLVIPPAAADGLQRRHTVSASGVTGSRGPWPIAGNARRVSFVISRQPAPGQSIHSGPAGSLLVMIGTGRAVWCPASSELAGPSTHQSPSEGE